MFIFKKVVIDNFKSIGHAELELDNQGLVLIEGVNTTNATFQSNGSGKSSILEAVTYALYDTTPNGLSGDKVVNRIVGKNTKVELDFSVDGVDYKIIRYRKYSKFKNTVKLFSEDQELTGATVKDTNARILELFSIDYKTYLNTIMYGQGNVEIFTKSTDKYKKEILENLTDIAIYQKAQALAKEELAQVEASIQYTKSSIVSTQQIIDFEKSKVEEAKAKMADYMNRIEAITKRLSVLDATITIKQEALSLELDKMQKDIDLLVNHRETHFANLTKPDTSVLDTQLNEVQEKTALVRATIQTLESTVRQDKQSLASLDLQDTCSLCGAPIDVTHKELEANRLNEAIEQNTEKITRLQQAIPLLAQKIKDIQEQVKQTTLQYDEQVNKAQELEKEINQLTYDLQRKQTAPVEPEAQQEHANLTNELGFIEKEKATLNTEYTNAIADREAELKELNTKLSELEKAREDYTLLIKDAFSNSGIRSVVLDLVTPFLNERANYYLSKLADSDIQVFLSTQKENADGSLKDQFTISVENNTGGEDYSANSAGEQKRVDLAIALALQDLVMSKSNLQTNLVLYDECFDGLDAIGCENVIEILKEKQKEIGSIFVITHNENLKALFDKVITVEKVDGISRIKGEQDEV